ncbi:hypothetical protein [Propionivibrio sp.]|uniref:hypothetical protein n=1 Tax=Propionivibrio sp. TaxID=2212460 RepID=UPI003BF061EC
MQAGFEGRLGIAWEVVLGKQTLQLDRACPGRRGEPDPERFALPGERSESEVPFTGFSKALDRKNRGQTTVFSEDKETT